MGEFEGKVVVVTGASSGIGAVTAIAFAKKGAIVVISGRDLGRLKDTATKCEKAGAKAVLEVVADLVKFENLEMLVDKVVKKFGQIDILINNAGFGQVATIEMLERDRYEEIFNANLRAPVFLCKYALPYLKKTKGCVVNVSSCAGLKAQPGVVPYCMTKSALDHFSRGFAAECLPFGVRVSSINPAAVETRFAENLNLPKETSEQMVKEVLKRQPLGMIQSDEIARGIMYLCSSPSVTGVCLPIDGGLMVAS